MRITASSLFRAAKTGRIDFIESYELTWGKTTHLTDLASKPNSRGETPLILASKNGHLNVVRYLIEDVRVDIDQRGKFWKRDRFCQINGTALHAAVIAGQSHIVNYLVDCCEPDIDATTKRLYRRDTSGGSTALHLAVIHLSGGVQKQIVTCLLFHGADWTIVDDHGDQCWELTNDVELSKLMIRFDVGLDSSRNIKSLNMAHKWARSFAYRSGEVVALAIDKGVNINEPDREGLTPLMIAAIGVNGKPVTKVTDAITDANENKRPNIGVMRAIFGQKIIPISRFDKIIALELIAATFISSGQLDIGLQFLKTSIEWRDGVRDEEPIPKPLIELIDDAKIAFKNAYEVQTLIELEDVTQDPNLLKMQAHLIRIRVLGLKHNETMRCLATYAFSIWYEDPQNFLEYIKLILKGFDSTDTFYWLKYYSKLIALSMIAIIWCIDEKLDKTNTFNNAMPILRKLVSLLPYASERIPFTIDFILDAIVNLAHVTLHDKPLTLQESTDLKRCLHQAVRLEKRNSKGLDLFLISCSSSRFSVKDIHCFEKTDDFNNISYQRYASAKTILILKEVGGDIHSVCNEGDTGLHILAKNTCIYFCLSSIKTLYEAGVHLDQTNLKGESMADILRKRGIELKSSVIPANILNIPRLKCICARKVYQFRSPLQEIPRDLVEFVAQHRNGFLVS